MVHWACLFTFRAPVERSPSFVTPYPHGCRCWKCGRAYAQSDFVAAKAMRRGADRCRAVPGCRLDFQLWSELIVIIAI